MSEPAPGLSLSPDAMRTLGYRVVDTIVEHLSTLPEQRVTGRAGRPELEARLDEPMPDAGRAPEEVLARLERDVFPYMMHVDHPRFFAFVPGPGNFVGAMADALAAGLNVFQGTWLASSGPSQLELTTVDWLREMCGLPADAGGLFVSGGSTANITALAVARYVRLADHTAGAVIYFSDQTHSSIERGLKLLGFSPAQMRRLPSDAEFRLDLEALRAAVAADRAAGLRPFCVVANAGTTNTGAVDPLPELAQICAGEALWLHADGAYGAASAVAARGRELLQGLERVDSLSLDPHKWLFQPFEIGCALVRDARWLRETFAVHPEYLRDTRVEGEEVNFAERGMQLTRQFRALKLWMSLQVFGRQGFAAAVERGFALAEMAEAELRGMPGWEVVTPAQMGIVSFRFAPANRADLDRLNSRIVEELYRDGFAFLSSTTLRGSTALRLCTINPRTSDEDVRATLRCIDRIGRHLAGS